VILLLIETCKKVTLADKNNKIFVKICHEKSQTSAQVLKDPSTSTLPTIYAPSADETI